MPDVFTKTKRSEVMSRIRGRGNKDTELALAKLLRRHGITGWRRQEVIVFGSRRREEGGSSRPSRKSASLPRRLRVKVDFVFPRLKLAIFVDGFFWHGCPKHATKPKNNRAFWRHKLASNKKRDVLVTRMLRGAGWRVLRIWEHELVKKNEAWLARRLSAFIRHLTRSPHPQPLSHPMGEGSIGFSPIEAERVSISVNPPCSRPSR